MTDQQLPPQNLRAEEHVLCAMMTAAQAVDAVRPILQPRDFARQSHGNTYRTIIDLADIGVYGDPSAVADELERRGQLQGEYTREHVLAIYNLLDPISNAAFKAGKIVETARLRDLIIVGQEIAQLGWLSPADVDASESRARDLIRGLDERRQGDGLTIETWHEFERQAHDAIPVLIEDLWPEAAFGFIAAPPKKGKTWVALAIAIAVATGKPLFGHYLVPTARPVLYAALEGHRAAIRARVGAIARGMSIDPDGPELDNLHFLYKPPGINLADPAWAQRLRRAAAKVDAALTIVDVLRAGARIKENDQGDFSALRANLQPISDDGRSLALLHHFTKLSEISKERDPGERMSGSGAMYGALDVGIYITGSENHARKLRLDFDLRDLATPPHLNLELQGEGTSENGGYGYRDQATWVVIPNDVAEDDLKAPAHELYDWIEAEGGDVFAKHLRARFEISDDTLTRRLHRLSELGVEYIAGRGKPGRLVIKRPTGTTSNLLTLNLPKDSAQPELPPAGTSPAAGTFPHNEAKTDPVPASIRTDTVRELESTDLQGEPSSLVPAPSGSAPAREGAPRTPAREGHNQEEDHDGESDLRSEARGRGKDQSRGVRQADQSDGDHEGAGSGRSDAALHPDQAPRQEQHLQSDHVPHARPLNGDARKHAQQSILQAALADVANGLWQDDPAPFARVIEKYPTLPVSCWPRIEQAIAQRGAGA